MDRFEMDMRLELQFCRVILGYIEKRHNQSCVVKELFRDVKNILKFSESIS